MPRLTLGQDFSLDANPLFLGHELTPGKEARKENLLQMGLTQVLEVCLQRRELKNLTAALPAVGACACGAWGALRLLGVWLRARSLCRHRLSTQMGAL